MTRALFALGLAVALLGGARASADDEPVSARAFSVKFKSLADAAEVVSPVLSPEGTVTLQPRLKTLTIQDHPAVLDRVGKLLDSFDTPPRSVDVTLSLFLGTDRRGQEPGATAPPASSTRDVRGVAETLSDFTKWNAYEPLGARSVSGTEGGRVTVTLSDEYRVSYDIEAVREQSVKLSHFVLQRVTRGEDGRERVQDVYSTAIVLPVGRMLMLGAAQNPESKRALFLALQAKPR